MGLAQKVAMGIKSYVLGTHPDARGWWLGLLKGTGDLKNRNPGSE